MSILNREGFDKKLGGMAKRLERLKIYQSLTFEEYLADEDRQAMVERYLEVVIQAAIDVNKMLIKQVSNTSLEGMNNTDIFRQVGQIGCITPDLAAQLALSAGFRNVLAHVYDDILPEVTYRALKATCPKFCNSDYSIAFSAKSLPRRVHQLAASNSLSLLFKLGDTINGL
jgi:uncharacterized protein YutE (UPF0331/DUF86 family)